MNRAKLKDFLGLGTLLVVLLLFFVSMSKTKSHATYHVASSDFSKPLNFSHVFSSSPITIITPTPILKIVHTVKTNVSPTPVQIQQVTTGFCLPVPVLLYHHIQPQSQAVAQKQTALSVDNGIFDQQMQYLSSHGYKTITAHDLANALVTKTPLPGRSVVVTVDDGYKDSYDYAFPIFKKYSITANLMIPTGLLEGNGFLSWTQLKEMTQSGLVFVTDHTWSHYPLGKADKAKITFEVMTSKSQLEQNIGLKVDIVTYPYGSFSLLAIDTLKENGFIGAYSSIGGTVQCDSFIMTLHRTHVGNAPLSSYGL